MGTIVKLVVALKLDDSDYAKKLAALGKAQQDFEQKTKRSSKATEKLIPTKVPDQISDAAKAFENLGRSIDTNSKKFNPLITAYDAAKAKVGSFVQGIKNVPGPITQAVASLSRIGTSLKTAFSQTMVGQLVGHLGKDLAAGLSRLAPIAQGALKGVGSAISSIGPMLASAAAGVGVAAGAIVGAFGAITAGAFSLAQSAAPVEGIRNAFAGLTAGIEGGSTAMLTSLQQASAGMVTNAELMRSFNQAAQLVSIDFAQKLPDAMLYLGKVSQATGADLGFLLNSLTVGVGRLSAPILDNLAIQVDLNQAYQDFADKNNVVVGSMTKTQQQAALMDQVLAKLQQNTANMPAVFGSASQIFKAFQVDLLNIKDAVGLDLLPTFTELFTTFRQFMPAIQAFGQGFAGTFSALVDVGKSFVKGLFQSMGVDFNALAGSSGQWGQNIVLQFAQGMASAIGAVISVLNQLGQAIASWLAPGSPPRLLPDIDQWGTSAAQEFLDGMTLANVNVLRDLSRQVESFIRSSMAGAESTAIAQAVLNARAAIEDAIAGGGDLIASLPTEVQAYATALLNVQQASEAVAAAQERVAEAQEVVAAAQDHLNDVTREYDERLRPISARLKAIKDEQEKFAKTQRRADLQAVIEQATAEGNTDAVRLAQLELEQMALEEQAATLEEQQAVEEAAAQEAVDAAQEQATAEQEALDLAEAQQQQAEEQLQIQQQLLQHQIETNNLLADTVSQLNAAGGAAGALGGAAGGASSLANAISGIGNVVPPVTQGISELAQKIMDTFAPIGEEAGKLGETWGGVFTGMIDKVGEFRDWVTEKTLQVSQAILTLINWLGERKEMWKNNFELMKQAAELFEQHVKEKFVSVIAGGLDLITKLQEYKNTWKDNFDLMKEAASLLQQRVEEKWNAIKTKISDVVNQLRAWKQDWVDDLTRMWEQMETARSKIESALSPVQSAISEVKSAVGDLLGAAQGFASWLASTVFSFNFDLPDLPDWAIPGSPLPLHTGWRDFGRFLASETFAVDFETNGFAGPIEAMAGMGVFGAEQKVVNNNQQTQVGPNHVSNGMDMAELVAVVNQVIRRQMS